MTHNNQQELTISNKYAGVLDINIPDNINEINLTGYHEGVTLKLIPSKESNASEEYSIDDFVAQLKDTYDYLGAYRAYDMTIDVDGISKEKRIIWGSVNIKNLVTKNPLLCSQFKIYLSTKDRPHFYMDIVGDSPIEFDLTDRHSLKEKADFLKQKLFDYTVKELYKTYY